MENFTVSLFGHRRVAHLQQLDERLVPLIRTLMDSKPFISFLIGRNGEFDAYCASVIKRLQKKNDEMHSEMTLVLPYTVADLAYYEKYYDHVLIPPCVHRAHPKSTISARNKWMVEQSDLVVVYAERADGGAYAALKYAQKQGKETHLLCDELQERPNAFK